MKNNPIVIKEDVLAVEAIKLMENNSITVLPVINDDLVPFGVIHLHALVSAGIA